MTEPKFLSVRLRAIAQATEAAERVSEALAFASGAGEVTATVAEGHFGNRITVFEAELKKKTDIAGFIRRLSEAGLLKRLAGESEARTDQACTFHFRLDKQKAYLGELALAGGKDVIDVRMKVGVYPARREEAVKVVSEWLLQQ